MRNGYKIGDEVRIINYGAKIFINKNSEPEYNIYRNHPHIIAETEKFLIVDIRPELIGRTGIINNAGGDDIRPHYAIAEIGAWFDNDQLELV